MSVLPEVHEVLTKTPRAGSIAAIEEMLLALTSARDRAESFALEMQHAGELLPGSHSDVTRRLQGQLEEHVIPAASALYLSTDGAQRAFATYLATLTDIYARANRVEVRAAGALEIIGWDMTRIEQIAAQLGLNYLVSWDAPPAAEMPNPPQSLSVDTAMRTAEWRTAVVRWQAALAALKIDRAQWQSLIDDRMTAETELRRACEHTPVGELIVLAHGTHAPFELMIDAHLLQHGRLSVWNGASPRSTDPLLTELMGTSDGSTVWKSPPDPDETAKRWLAMPDWKREALIAHVPWVIGNLPGVAFADRDRANRIMLEAYIANQSRLSSQSRLALAEVMQVMYAGDDDPPRSLVALNLGDGIPSVAVGYGSLDTADRVNWGVPGMLSDAQRAVPSWDRAMDNQFKDQRRVLLDEPTERSALIAFLSYDTPNLVTVLDADAARLGADRLVAELDGTFAARAANDSPVTHGAIGHSYGTTTLVAAASRITHPLDQITLVASAGLDAQGLESFAGLQVEHDEAGNPRVYTTLAETDWLARFGTDISGRLQPNPGEAALPWLAVGTAYEFSSDGLGELKATEGHSIINSRTTGYFDLGTQSSRAIAAIAMGEPGLTPGGLSRTPESTVRAYLGPGVYSLTGGMKQ